jgi:hypothetical protein
LEKSKIKGGNKMNYPEMKVVSSSNIAELGYDQESQTVYVRFLNGSLYIYKGVPEYEFDNLFNAPSLGSYLHRNFKNVYPYERIE